MLIENAIMREVLSLSVDVGENAVLILAVDYGLGEACRVSDDDLFNRLTIIRKKLESSIKPFSFTVEQMLLLMANLEGLKEDARGRGLIAVLHRIRESVVVALRTHHDRRWRSDLQHDLRPGTREDHSAGDASRAKCSTSNR